MNTEEIKKWEDILNSTDELSKDKEDFPSLLPIAMKIAKTTIGQDLGLASEEEINSVKKRIISENRDGKIESIINGEEFKEKTLEEDEEYKELMKKGVVTMSSAPLFYLDFKSVILS